MAIFISLNRIDFIRLEKLKMYHLASRNTLQKIQMKSHLFTHTMQKITQTKKQGFMKNFNQKEFAENGFSCQKLTLTILNLYKL